MQNLPPKIPARIRELVSQLGLRYRPTAQADLEAHAAQLALLAVDLAEMPPKILEQAVNRHVVKSPYMPKAAELIDLCRQIQQEGGGHVSGKLTRDDIANIVKDYNQKYTWCRNYLVFRDGKLTFDQCDGSDWAQKLAENPINAEYGITA